MRVIGGEQLDPPADRHTVKGVAAGEKVEIERVRGCSRQISAKPICRLDDIFEPAQGDAKHPEVLRFAPEEPSTFLLLQVLCV
jgi:hypothetical protein